MQHTHTLQHRPDSPSGMLPQHAPMSLKHPHSAVDTMFSLQDPVYAGIPQQQQEFGAMMDHDIVGQKQQGMKVNGFGPAHALRPAGYSFSSNSRPRTNTAPALSTSTSFRDGFFPRSSSEMYGHSVQQQQSHITSPTVSAAQAAAFDPARFADYPNGTAASLSKQSYGSDIFNTSQSLLAQQQQSGHPSLSTLGKHQQTSQAVHLNGYHSTHAQAPYVNGVHVQSQTPYGPHLQTNGAVINGLTSANSLGNVNGIGVPNGGQDRSGGGNSQQEEISTIFVVGFPDDMQEREFQNMFTFSQGFEAATLKIPNKEYTAYGGPANNGNNTGTGLASRTMNYSQYGGSNDPYNLVTVNQGGVVVDGGREGTTTSWPATVPGLAPEENGAVGGHFGSQQGAGVVPPRKQIIGFAKFRTRNEALEARDMLQGRRVDIEKGAVLKAEMAKKNLHTKRGVGLGANIGLGGNPSGTGSGGMINGLGDFGAGIGSIGAGLPSAGPGSLNGADAITRDTLGAMGFPQWARDAPADEQMQVPQRRGARERAEEEERERRKRDRDRLRPFDPFHSGGPTPLPARQHAGMMDGNVGVSAFAIGVSVGAGVNGGPLDDEIVGPWDPPRKVLMQAPPRPPSSNRHASSPSREQQSQQPINPANFSPPLSNSVLPLPGHARRPRSMSSASGSSGNAGAVSGGEGMSGAEDGLALSTDGGNGTTSPQLPSPASGASSGGTRNAVDQNPPINTLYVGNLPTSPGYPPNQLEDSLRELFSRQPGFRKLCFRQKSNGPMCFVEFEDVQHATRALNALYGNTLGGLVKGGGIRLSYSKNPLGVRTPTNTGAASAQQQQQQMQQMQNVFASLAVDTAEVGTRNGVGGSSVMSPSNFNYMMSQPPPRFFSPAPPSNNSFALNARPNHSTSSGVPTTFSPFGMPSPPQVHTAAVGLTSEQSLTVNTLINEQPPYSSLSPTSSNGNIEAARAA